MAPFWLRRPGLLLRDLTEDRDRPDLERLAAIEDAEEFVWAILPHAARTFSACILLLPGRAALAAAVAYLHCRILDTYEDLLPDRAAREAALSELATRLDTYEETGRLPAAPPLPDATTIDARDRAHVLLVERTRLVDAVYRTLPDGLRAILRDLVRDMALGMCWSSATFAAQGGVLRGEAQLALYCRHVLGNPVVFTVRTMRHLDTGERELPPEVHEDSMRVGELIQLANVTRDIEKDLARGIAYHADLADDLGRTDTRRPGRSSAGDAAPADPDVLARIARVRRELMRMALLRAPSYRRMTAAMATGRVSLARASALLMLLFTDRYYARCATRCDVPTWGRRRSSAALLLRALPGVVSKRWTARVLERVERDFLAAASSAEALDEAR